MNRNNLVGKTLIIVLFIASLILIVGQNIQVYAFETHLSINEQDDAIVYNKATIDDNFTEDTLLITLTQDTIFDFRKYTTSDFPELNLASVTEITDDLYSRIEKQIKDEEIGILNDNTTEIKMNINKFRRILKLELLEPSKENVLKSIELLEKRGDIRSAEPNYIGMFCSLTPNDPARADQWALNYLQLPSACTISTGSSTVRVGIADSGIDRNHPDLAGRINEALSRDHSGGGNPWFTTNVHGTHVAGIVGAAGNNSIGISGVNWNVELVSLKVGNQEPTAVAVAEAITFANANEIRVLNLNLSINETQAINDAISAFDGVVICAAGNSTSDTVGYPARVNNHSIISVGSLDSNSSRSSFSNWGKVEVWAPGGNILSTIAEGPTPIGYGRHSNGYAYAAPYVAGVAALMLSVNPDLTPQQIQSIIVNNGNTISITVPNPGFWPWEWDRTKTIIVKQLNAYETLKHVPVIPEPHVHQYSYSWLNLRQHQSTCLCGDTRIRPHIVSSNWNGTGYATCLECGGPAEVGFVEINNRLKMIHLLPSIFVNEYFGNNSYILSNGVIVLSDIDLEAYYEGMLVLPDLYDVDNHRDYGCQDCSSECINYDSSCCEYVDYNVIYACNDRRKTQYIPTNEKRPGLF